MPQILNDSILPTIEIINKRFGKQALQMASAKLSDYWKMNQNHISPKYTTDINELLVV